MINTFLKTLGENPTQENLDMVKYEIQRSAEIVDSIRRNEPLSEGDEESIKYELDLQYVANSIKVKIATVLVQSND